MIHFNPSKILIPVDFSETSLLAIKHGAFTAQYTKADLLLLHVINTPFMSQNMFLPIVTLEDQSHITDKAMEKLAQLAMDIKHEYGVNAESIIRTGNPSNEIVKAAVELGTTLIVMGTHGYSPIEELVIGSVALKVITKAPCPTMAMSNAATHKGYKKVVIPIDTTVNSKQKVNFSIELAKKFNASLNAIVLLDADEESQTATMELVLRQVQDLAREKGVAFHSEIIQKVTNRATATVDFVEKNEADLLIIMTDQDAELSGFFLGPYSQQVIHKSKVPVIAIKPAELFIVNSGMLPGTSGM